MSGAAPEAEATRARPLSGGLWALISWLRRDDSGASSDSLSSVGSDRTVASFAFLSPDRYTHPAGPVLLRPPPPPTDSYKKRVRDRNTRLQHDRDLTLHRKYGLFRGDGYDAFSLPPARKFTSENKDWEERERRAASECLQRRAAHVPGKRRAPPPPVRSATLGPPRRSRKRRAPQPPRRPLGETGGNAAIPEEPLLPRIGPDLDRRRPPFQKTEAMDCKPEKYVKKEVKDSKPRVEKSFLKQIFESRKRNSTVDAIPERILPSISELDKQATEIIESCKLKALDRSERIGGTSRELVTPSRGDMWFCTRCLRKYDDSVVTCGHCVTEQKMKLNNIPGDGDRRLANRASNHYTQTAGENVTGTCRVTEAEEKQKLKEMLKEIKDSLPKRSKHDANVKESTSKTASGTNKHTKPSLVETPTLRIGSTISDKERIAIHSPNNNPIQIEGKPDNDVVNIVTNLSSASATEMAIVTQPIILQHVPSRDIIKLEHFERTRANAKQEKAHHKCQDVTNNRNESSSPSVSSKESNIPIAKYMCYNKPALISNEPLSTPLKISSLLNSNPLPEIQLSRGQQKNNNTTVSDSGAKLLFPQELTTQKPLKANTTTQTSNVLTDIAVNSKQNAPTVKDIHMNRMVNNLSNDADQNPERKKILPTSTQSSVDGARPNKVSLSHNSPANNKEVKVETRENQQIKVTPLITPTVISGELTKFDVPLAFDHHQCNATTKIVPFELHSRRRALINQLEQSIAKGDERAAADAAAKLAQLRLSCSVLSFSSQIVGAPSASSSTRTEKTNESTSKNINMEPNVTVTAKVETQRHSPEIKIIQNTPSKGVVALASNAEAEKKTVQSQSQSRDIENKNKPVSNDHHTLDEPSTSKQNKAAGTDIVSIEVWIEDREAARGPIRMNMPRLSVMGDLRRQANTTFGLATHLQRWIVGRNLCTNDNTRLEALAGPQFDAPFYLCLVEPETNKHTGSRHGASSASSNNIDIKNQNARKTIEDNKTTDVYAELVLLERRALVPNAEKFECGVCMENYDAGQGAVLRECVHTFCRECLSDVVKHSEEPVVACPAMGCPGVLHEREIRALVSPEDYERWLARGLAAAESGTRNAFHCRTRDCHGWALCEPGVTRFPCPVCKRTNCVSCQAIHEGDTCKEYRAKQRASEAAKLTPEETDEGTRAFLDTLISRGEALECPECSAIITKKWGCDWIKCSACKTEICWVTRGRRWGPGGRGDTSAGCRCGVDGKRCHPSCGYCH